MSNKEVLTDGFGKAGSVLHLPVWVENGYRVTGHDSNADRLNVANLSDTNRAYFEAGKLALSSSLADQDPSIVDITTASGHHVEAIEQVLDADQVRQQSTTAVQLDNGYPDAIRDVHTVRHHRKCDLISRFRADGDSAGYQICGWMRADVSRRILYHIRSQWR